MSEPREMTPAERIIAFRNLVRAREHEAARLKNDPDINFYEQKRWWLDRREVGNVLGYDLDFGGEDDD